MYDMIFFQIITAAHWLGPSKTTLAIGSWGIKSMIFRRGLDAHGLPVLGYRWGRLEAKCGTVLQYAHDLRRAELSAECIHVATKCSPLRTLHTNKIRGLCVSRSLNQFGGISACTFIKAEFWKFIRGGRSRS